MGWAPQPPAPHRRVSRSPKITEPRMSHSIQWPLEPADPDTFRGSAFIRLVAAASESEFVKAYYVRFEPGARTNWHAHSGDQILIVTAGRCRYQIQGHAPVDLDAGASVRFMAGTRHWHGASPSEAGEHLAINIEARDTTWLEPVSDEQYASS